MHDISDIKFIFYIAAYLVSIFFFDFREQKKSERHVLASRKTSTRIGSCLFVLFVRGRSSQVKVK